MNAEDIIGVGEREEERVNAGEQGEEGIEQHRRRRRGVKICLERVPRTARTGLPLLDLLIAHPCLFPPR